MTSFIRNLTCARCKHGFPPSLMKTVLGKTANDNVHVCKDTKACLKRQRERSG